jgi:tripartite-type tricarboxylate transporter receptor subunit TctC
MPESTSKHRAALAAVAICVGVAPWLAPLPAFAQDYPAKPVRVIVPYAPGGPTEFVSRTVGDGLAKRLGQSFLIESRPGANTRIGTEAAARAPADGYTLLLVSTPFSTNPALFPSLPYDTVRDFRAVVHMVNVPTAIFVPQDSALKNVGDLVALARAKPGEVTVGTAGNATSTHLLLENLSMLTGAQFTHVPFKGDAPSVTELIAGRISASINPLGVPLPHVKSGRLRAISVNVERRLALLPDVPTLTEQGLKEATSSTWFGLAAHSGVSNAIVGRLNSEAVAILALPEVRERLADTGLLTVGGTPEQFDAHIRAEIQRWGTVIRARGIKVE